jgi:hypothetical protein
MEVIPMMNKGTGKARQIVLILALVAAVTVFGVLPAHAGPAKDPAPQSTADLDSDGVLDAMETNTTSPTGVTFSSVVIPATGRTGSVTYPTCGGSVTGTARNACLKSDSKDVFVFIKKLTSSKFHLDLLDTYSVNLDRLLEPVWRPTTSPSPYPPYLANTGLGVAVHRLIPPSGSIIWTNTSRSLSQSQVSPYDQRANPQKAIFITESDNTANPEMLGSTFVGTPNYSGGDIKIYTQSIRDQVTRVCNGTTVTTCMDMNGASGIEPVIKNWQIHVASHEVAHSLMLRRPLDINYREHYATATGSTDLHTILEQAMYKEYPESSKAVFYISLDFTSNEPATYLFYQ